MLIDLSLKQEIHNTCQHFVETKLADLEEYLRAVEDARNNETKSSAGDKYETSRAMMQQEADKIIAQKENYLNLKNELEQIQTSKAMPIVNVGALVSTNQGIYYLAVGIGRVNVMGSSFFVISKDSPIGALLLHKKAGDSIIYNGETILISSIL